MAQRKITYRTLNNFDYKENSDANAGPEDPGVSLTVQSQAEDADINVLMRRYGITGKMPENVKIPTYGDFSEISDYRTAIEAVRRADIGFMEIPAEVRAKFDNNPQRFLEFCSNEQNRPAMQEMGLLKLQAPETAQTPPSPGGTGQAQTQPKGN